MSQLLLVSWLLIATIFTNAAPTISEFGVRQVEVPRSFSVSDGSDVIERFFGDSDGALGGFRFGESATIGPKKGGASHPFVGSSNPESVRTRYHGFTNAR